MSAFRDQFDPQATVRFTQHLGIAEHCLAEIESIPTRIEAFERAQGGVSRDALERWTREWSKGWADCWEQLREARAIVASQGRDTSGFDAAFASAGDIYLETAKTGTMRAGNSTLLTWQNTPTSSAHAAIAALRAAVPEVVATRQPEAQVDLEAGSTKVVTAVIVVAGLSAFAFFVYKVITGH